MSQKRVLIVEDEATLRRIIADALTLAGYSVVVAEDGEVGLQRYRDFNPHLVIADIMLPRLDGYEMVRKMRKIGGVSQYLFLSARSQVDDVVEGFRAGGNDYLRKPFDIKELIVRTEALLSRVDAGTNDIFHIGNYTFNSGTQQLTIADFSRHLSTRESELLRALASNMNRRISSNKLLVDIWGDDSYYNLRSMNVYISKLRTYLSDDPTIEIVSIRGIGYALRVIE